MRKSSVGMYNCPSLSLLSFLLMSAIKALYWVHLKKNFREKKNFRKKTLKGAGGPRQGNWG